MVVIDFLTGRTESMSVMQVVFLFVDFYSYCMQKLVIVICMLPTVLHMFSGIPGHGICLSLWQWAMGSSN